MHIINARNVHEALAEGVRYITACGDKRESRNGPVLVAPGPVATVYRKPMEKVEFWQERDSNPTFHLMEALWMLAGRNDVEFPTFFNSSFGQFSDDGTTFNGAYGYRWRQHFAFDQLKLICDRLKANPDDRRQVLSMWHPQDLLHQNTKDIPCNTHAYFGRGVRGELNMTVCCRSNDLVWGAYGSNAVHFAFLLEYMAARIGCEVGTYTQISNNFHGYIKTLDPLRGLAEKCNGGSDNWNAKGILNCPYTQGVIGDLKPLMGGTPPDMFDQDLRVFMSEGPVLGMQNRFLRTTAGPMLRAYAAFKDKNDPARFEKAIEIVSKCESIDWRLACVMWYSRRRAAQANKEKSA